MFFVILGTLLHDYSRDPRIRERGAFLGVIATLATIVISVIEGVDWANLWRCCPYILPGEYAISGSFSDFSRTFDEVARGKRGFGKSPDGK